MNIPSIIGNWKCNKTIFETKTWLDAFEERIKQTSYVDRAEVVICAPYTLLYFLKDEIIKRKLPLKLGAQDVSPFSEGAYTGEICAKQIKEFADYVIIGHTERRKYFHESDDVLAQKVMMAKQEGLIVLYCIFEETARVPQGVDVISYEPVWAIGTGQAETPENANKTINTIKQRTNKELAIYGGSVTSENVHAFVTQGAINGVLPGKASLDAYTFHDLIIRAIG
jgi:triosephosphate isomerase (TIM)